MPRFRLLTLLACATFPYAALAQHARADSSDPVWSVGAGINLSLTQPFGALGVATPDIARLPVASASVERMLGGGLWLVAGVMGGYGSSTSEPDPQPANQHVETDQTFSGIGLSAGARYELNPGSPVVVSGLGLLTFGTGSTKQNQSTTAGGVTNSVSRTESSTGVGVSAGLTVEKMLTDRLGLRIATTLARIGWTHATAAATKTSGFNVGVTIDPGLELRLYF
jgi:hypothetical protein